MRKIVLLLMLCCCMAASAQQKKIVKVTTLKGSVFQGPLEELNTFEHVIVSVDGKYELIPFEDVAYIDEVKQNTAEPQQVAVEPVLDSAASPVEEPEPAKAGSKRAGYKGFLLEGGNSVYLSCMSSPKNVEFDEAAVDVLTRQVSTDGFWRIADRPEDAQFSIVCHVTPNGGKATLAISSDITACMDELGGMKSPEDVTEFRKLVWELYTKYITPLQKKIEKNAVPKHTLKIFTVE
jgi:hypothetical protein